MPVLNRLQLARAIELDRLRVERIGTRAANRIAMLARMRAMNAVIRGQDPADAVEKVLMGQRRDDLKPLLSDAMVVSHLQGYLRTDLVIDDYLKKHPEVTLFARSAYDESVTFLKKQLDMTEADLENIRRKYDQEAALIVENIGHRIGADLRQVVYDSVREDLHPKQVAAEIRQTMAARGFDPSKGHMIETVFRTQTQIAYNAGRWNSLQDPAVQDILWGFEYSAVGDDRMTELCEKMDGVRRMKEHPIWNEYTPPNHYNCRSTLMEVFNEDAGDVGKVPDEHPARGFGFNPGQVFDDGLASARPILTPEEVAVRVNDLLDELKKSDDTDEKKRIRRELRKLGHKGGLKETPPPKPPKPEVPVPPPPPQVPAATEPTLPVVDKPSELKPAEVPGRKRSEVVRERIAELSGGIDQSVIDDLYKRKGEAVDKIVAARKEGSVNMQIMWTEEKIRLHEEIERVSKVHREAIIEAIKLPPEDRADIRSIPLGKASERTMEKANSAAEFLSSIVHKDSLSLSGGFSVPVKEEKRNRAQHRGGQIFMNAHSPVRTFVHEMGHAIEYNSSNNYRAADGFLRKRAEEGGYKLAKLKDLNPGTNYRSDERAWVNKKFIDNYMGKHYDHPSTEITSMGTEMLYSDPVELMTRDPEMFDFLIDSLQTPRK